METVENVETAPIADEPLLTEEEQIQVAEPEAADEATETTDEAHEETRDTENEEGEPTQKPRPQTTAAERIQQLVEKNRQLEAEMNQTKQNLESKLDAVMKQTQTVDPDLMPIDMVAVDQYMTQQMDRYDELRLEGKSVEALKVLKSINKLNDDIDAHEARRQQKLQEQNQRETIGKTYEQITVRLNEAAKLVQAEFKMSDEVFAKAAQFFQAEQAKSPVLSKRYAEIVERQGEMAAILFAKDYCDKHMGKTAQKQNEARSEAKNNLPPTMSAVSNQSAADNVKALYAAAMADPHDTDKYTAWKQAQRQLK